MNETWLNSHNWNQNNPHGPLGKRGEQWFQRELDKITGRDERTGVHRFKLAWGQRELTFNAFRGEWLPRFMWGKPERVFKSVGGILVSDLKIYGVPRYFLLGFTGSFTPQKFQKDGYSIDGTDYEHKPDGEILVQKRETKYFAAPDVPDYRLEHIFSAHQTRKNPTDPYAPCCLERMANYDHGYNRCYGRYVEPNQQDLDDIRISLAAQWETFKHAPTGTITHSQYEWIQRRMESIRAKEEADEKAELEYSAKHNAPTVINAMNRANGERRWSFPTAGEKK